MRLQVFGWQDDSLQLAMDNQCYLRNCSFLPSQMPPDKNKCSVPVTAPENIDGCEFARWCYLRRRVTNHLQGWIRYPD